MAKQRLPTNTTTYQHPIHRWFNFIAGFSPEFVQECCAKVAADGEACLLDPFTGCATSLLVARQRGMRSIGFEPHPFFVRIARAKFPGADAFDQLDEIERVLKKGFLMPRPVSVLPEAPAIFLRKLFPEDALESMLGAREALNSAELATNDLAFLVLSRVLDKSSHSQTDGIYKAPTSKKNAASPSDAFLEAIGTIRSDLLAIDGQNFQDSTSIFEESSEDMRIVPCESVSIIVTSPPYLNNFDFAEMTRMYLYFWGIARSWGEITEKVRSKLVVNTTTALKGHKNRQQQYRANVLPSLCQELDALVKELASRRATRAGKKEYDYLVYPYFSQMTNVLRECFRCLRHGSPIHVMVADAALYGVHISTPQLLCQTLEGLGFRNASCSLVRRRGHRWILAKREGSKTGLGEYHVKAIK
ncbi:MAG: DNA methylase [Planctomycetes bacterium]|nr:DNA methylase [Planctomycetota bacterium]